MPLIDDQISIHQYKKQASCKAHELTVSADFLQLQ